MKHYLNFGGFYCSVHEQLIDNMLEGYYWEGGYNDLDINYNLIFNEYIKEYVYFFEEYLKESYDVDIHFKNISLYSPKNYNYDTDKIEVETDSDLTKLENIIKSDQNFVDYVRDSTRYYDGYIPVYRFDEVFEDNSATLDLFMFDYIFKNDDILEEWLKYYDLNSVYEIVYKIKMP